MQTLPYNTTRHVIVIATPAGPIRFPCTPSGTILDRARAAEAIAIARTGAPVTIVRDDGAA